MLCKKLVRIRTLDREHWRNIWVFKWNIIVEDMEE